MNKYIPILSHALILASLLASSHALLKWVSVQPNSGYVDMLFSQWKGIFAALALYGFIFFYYIVVLRSSPVSILYPVYTGLSVLFVLLAGRYIFSEPLSSLQVIGAGFVLAGIVLMGAGR
jgi:small multidrug resistance pump